MVLWYPESTIGQSLHTHWLCWFTGVGELQAALQLNFKPIVAAVVNVNEYEQRTGGKQLPVDQQGGDMGLGILTQ